MNRRTLMVEKDYSQDREQDAILDALEGIGRGRFLDIGAFHPAMLSNTRALYEMGWEGIMVEPSPAPLLTLIAEYGNDPRIKIISAVVVPTDDGGITQMKINDGPYSTSDPRNYAKWASAESPVLFTGTVHVPVLPLHALMTALGPFDFINIDVEGGSNELFYRMLEVGKPQCVCVEYDDHRAEIERRAEGSGYAKVFDNAVNIIFARTT